MICSLLLSNLVASRSIRRKYSNDVTCNRNILWEFCWVKICFEILLEMGCLAFSFPSRRPFLLPEFQCIWQVSLVAKNRICILWASFWCLIYFLLLLLYALWTPRSRAFWFVKIFNVVLVWFIVAFWGQSAQSWTDYIFKSFRGGRVERYWFSPVAHV